MTAEAFAVAFRTGGSVLVGAAVLLVAGFDSTAMLGALQVAPHAVAPPPWIEAPTTTVICDVEDPLPVLRPLQPGLLDVRTSVTAAAELDRIRADLERGLADVQDSEREPSFEFDLARRLTLFPWRFGCEPASLPGWAPVAEAAQAALDPQPSGRAIDWAGSDPLYGGMLRAFLLAIVGQRDEADHLLASLPTGSWCGNCAAARAGLVADRRSELAEARGDAPAALRWLESVLNNPFAGFQASQDPDLASRYGLLLVQAGRDSDGVCMLQQVVDLSPGTAGGEVARAALEQMGALRETTPAGLRHLYIRDPGKRDPRRRMALTRLVGGGAGDAPADFDALVEACGRGDLQAWKQLAALHDMNACVVLRRGLRTSKRTAIIVQAARGLFAVDGSEVPLADAVARIEDETDLEGPYSGAELDAAVRELTGEGPALPADPAPDLRAVAHAWRTWLASAAYR